MTTGRDGTRWEAVGPGAGGHAARALTSTAAFVLVACTNNVEENPAPPDPPFPTAKSRSQAETALVVARGPGGAARVVIAYNDSTSEGTSGEIVVSADLNAAQTRKGASQVAWSFSDDNGSTWTRGSKLRPTQPAFTLMDSDPSLAVDPGDRSIVYFAAAAASLEAWNSVGSFAGPDGQAPQTGDLRNVRGDGVCVGRSTDGGATFPDVECFLPPPGASTVLRGWLPRVDAPKVQVDGAGCVWIAVEDRQETGTIGTLLFRTRPGEGGSCRGTSAQWKPLLPIAPEPAPGADPDDLLGLELRAGELRPILRADDDGDVWLSTEDIGSPGTVVQLRSFGMPNAAVPGWNFAGLVPTECDDDEPVRGDLRGLAGNAILTVGQGSKQQTIRSLHKFDFDVDRSQPGTTRVRYAFTESRSDAVDSEDWFLQVGETVRTDGAGGPVVGSCRTPAGWSTRDEATQGQTIQPLIRRTSRNAAGVLPATVEWWASGITNGNTFDPAEAQARVLAFPVVGSAFGAPRDLSVLTNYPVCSTQIRGYWGDYFGLLGFLGANGSVRHVAAITDSRGAVCTRGLAEASPTHIKAVLWGTTNP